MNTTNSYSLTNDEIRSLIEQLRYESRFGCISNSYFRNVIEKEQYSKPYLLIYGDFNDVGKCNEKHGFKQTNKFLKSTLTETKKYLQNKYNKEVECVSLGGDEFLFIIRDIEKSEVSANLLNNINYDVFSNCELSMSLGCFHSQESNTPNPTFQSILKEAQKEAEENKKAKNLINQDDVSLQDKFLSTLQTYLRSIPVEGLSKEEKTEILNAILRRLEHKIKNPEKTNITINSNPSTYDSTEKKMLSTNWQDNREELLEVLNLLGTNPITSGTRKSAFFKLIPHKRNEKFHYALIDISKLKLSNILFGHENTDIHIGELIESIKAAFAKEGVTISTFDYLSNLDPKNNSNFIVNLHGCKLMLMISKSTPNMNQEKIDNILSTVQQECSKRTLGITYVCSKTPQKLKSEKAFDKRAYRLTKQCNKQKALNAMRKTLNPNTQKKWLQELEAQLEIDYIDLMSSNIDYKVFEENLNSAFSLLPVMQTSSNYFDSLRQSPSYLFRENFKLSPNFQLSPKSRNTLSSINFDKISSVLQEHESHDNS